VANTHSIAACGLNFFLADIIALFLFLPGAGPPGGLDVTAGFAEAAGIALLFVQTGILGWRPVSVTIWDYPTVTLAMVLAARQASMLAFDSCMQEPSRGGVLPFRTVALGICYLGLGLGKNWRERLALPAAAFPGPSVVSASGLPGPSVLRGIGWTRLQPLHIIWGPLGWQSWADAEFQQWLGG